MLNYRIWQANREIFLYPENYLDPSLRRSKTKLFADLENQLQQGEITDPTVDPVFRAYVDGLCRLARLDYVYAYSEHVNVPPPPPVDHPLPVSLSPPTPYPV